MSRLLLWPLCSQQSVPSLTVHSTYRVIFLPGIPPAHQLAESVLLPTIPSLEKSALIITWGAACTPSPCLLIPYDAHSWLSSSHISAHLSVVYKSLDALFRLCIVLFWQVLRLELCKYLLSKWTEGHSERNRTLIIPTSYLLGSRLFSRSN